MIASKTSAVSQYLSSPSPRQGAEKLNSFPKRTLNYVLKIIFCGFLTCSSLAAESAEPSVDSAELPQIAPTEPDQALSTFQVRPGFRLELVASEPLVADPVAMSFDENGRLFVAEMIGYSERQHERLGRIRLLEDTDGDGHFDTSSVFADQLPWPTAVICYGGGVFVAATPDIHFFKDTDGDGIANVREVVFTGFGEGVDRLNVQRLPNSFRWGLDNRIHGANGGSGARITSLKNPNIEPLNLGSRDYSFDPETFNIRTETGGGQNGMSFDDSGRKFVCSNSAHIQTILFDERLARRNALYSMPNPFVHIPEDGPSAEVYRISPDEPWRVVRTMWRIAGLVPGPVEGGGRVSGYFTAATGITIYRGNAWPSEFLGDAFIADSGSNLIHRKKLHRDGVSLIARRPDDEQETEFAASTDNWFRPVQFANAPDGTLYVLDMYRQTIEHPWSLPESIKKHVDLNNGNNRGRIYRIVPDGFNQPDLPRLGLATTAELVNTLEHPNGWHRDTAARLLFERKDKSAAPLLDQAIRNSNSSIGRLHALYALDGMGKLTTDHVESGFSDSDPRIRIHSIRLSHRFLDNRNGFRTIFASSLLQLLSDPDPNVRFELAMGLHQGESTGRINALSSLLQTSGTDRWVSAAALNALGDRVRILLFVFRGVLSRHSSEVDPVLDLNDRHSYLIDLSRMIGASGDSADIGRAFKSARSHYDKTAAFNIAASLFEASKGTSTKKGFLDTETTEELNAFFQEAKTAASNPELPESRRIGAVRLLGLMDWDEARKHLPPLLNADQSRAVQSSVVRALARFTEIPAAQELVEKWTLLTPRLRTQVLTSLLARSDRIPTLLAAIENHTINPSELSATELRYLNSHRDPKIRNKAAALFSTNQPMKREQAIQKFLPSLNLQPRSGQGNRIFLERCASCHRQGNDGYTVGPDFESVKSNDREKLLISIIDPNREVAPNYLNYTIETKDGETLMGLIANENDTSVTLRRAFADETILARTRVESIQSSSQSVMPEGLEAELSLQEMADLLDFIVTGGESR